jgi:AraC-like DNA-binding protein
MDPLSDVLALLKPRSYASRGFGVSGKWSVQFPNYDGIKCYAVISGQGWLSVEDVPDPVQLKPGDCFVLPSGRPFRLATDLSATPVDFRNFLSSAKLTHTPTRDGSEDCFIAGGHFAFTRSHASILLGVLPPIVHIQRESDRTALRWCIERMTQEVHEPQPGGSLIAEHLAYMMLIQALRLHLAEGLKGGVGWLFALADKQMSTAITAIHDDPAHHWTLQELAKRAGMSRSIFALRFKQKVGTSPMEYLTRWRMLLAADRLTNSRDPISEIAWSLGYESESAFSTAFKRVMGCAPRRYSRARQPVLPSAGTGELAHIGRTEPGADLGAAGSRMGLGG